MTIEEPPANNDIDFEVLAEVDRDADRLFSRGSLTRAAYAALEARGLRAVAGHDGHLETLRMLGGLAGVL